MRCLNKKGGFTLLELVVAIVVVSIASSALFVLFRITSTSMYESFVNRQMTAVGKSVMSSLVHFPSRFCGQVYANLPKDMGEAMQDCHFSLSVDQVFKGNLPTQPVLAADAAATGWSQLWVQGSIEPVPSRGVFVAQVRISVPHKQDQVFSTYLFPDLLSERS